MRVILFRHGPAGRRDPERWPDDSVRPLTPQGAQLTRAVANGLAVIDSDVGVVASSSYARARQTARVLAHVLDAGAVEELEDLRPGGSPARILDFLAARASDRTVLLVGHEPDLGALAGMLLFGAPVSLPLKKAGACSMRFDGEPHEGTGRLSWFMPPKVLRQQSSRKLRI